MSTALRFVPRLRALRSFFCDALSPVLTKKEPTIDATIPTVANIIGRAIALKEPNASTPSAHAEITELT